jgi:hypothetical protein
MLRDSQRMIQRWLAYLRMKPFGADYHQVDNSDVLDENGKMDGRQMTVAGYQRIPAWYRKGFYMLLSFYLLTIVTFLSLERTSSTIETGQVVDTTGIHKSQEMLGRGKILIDFISSLPD